MVKNTETAAADGEVLTGKEVATIGGGATAVMLGGMAYDVIAQVNLPTLKHETGETVAVRIEAPIREEVSYKEDTVVIDGEKKVVQKENVINVVRVTELGSGQAFEYVCNAMTADNLRAYAPNDGYVGRCFGIQKLGVVQGKRYKQTNVVEIQPRVVEAA